MRIQKAVEQLQKSERGRHTCELLFEFLNSPTVKGLDDLNYEAVGHLVTAYMLGDCNSASAVITALRSAKAERGASLKS